MRREHSQRCAGREERSRRASSTPSPCHSLDRSSSLPRKNKPSSSSRLTLNITTFAFKPARPTRRDLVVRIQDRDIVRRLIHKDPVLGGRVVRETIRNGPGDSASRSDRSRRSRENPRSSRAESSTARRPSMRLGRCLHQTQAAACRYFRRPASRCPHSLSNSPISVVVVVLPFDPVMPTMRPFINRYASSTSPITSPSFRSTYRAGMVFVGTPGEMTTRSI